eukprot:1513691-Amphidinium_carterae.1
MPEATTFVGLGPWESFSLADPVLAGRRPLLPMQSEESFEMVKKLRRSMRSARLETDGLLASDPEGVLTVAGIMREAVINPGTVDKVEAAVDGVKIRGLQIKAVADPAKMEEAAKRQRSYERSLKNVISDNTAMFSPQISWPIS